MNSPKEGFIGKSVKRREDARFLTGRGQYTDDIVLPRQTYGVFVRSAYAHARLKRADTAAALAAPGVLGVYTGEHFRAVGGLPCGWLITSTDGQAMKEPKHPILADGKVRYVGDALALVVAESLAEAKAAAALVEVDYDELPAVADTATAAGHAGQVHDEAPDNRCYIWGCGDKAATDAAMAGAAHVTRLEFRNNRLIPNAIEPRAANASYNPADDAYTLYVANQNPHVERLLMCAFVLGIPEHKLRVVAPDVGGGFGSKIFLYAEETALVWASRQLGRPIKWTAERSESFLSDAHGRDHVTTAELGTDKAGNFLAMRVHTTANLGAYLSTFASCVPTILYATLLAGQYRTPKIYAEVTGVFTNTAPVDAYRGAGRPEATYVVERLVETAAHELGLDPAELRRRNFIKEFPYATPVGLTYDTGDYDATLTQVQKIADVAGFAARKAVSAAKGLLRGIGYSTYIEACGLAPSNVAGALGARAGLFEAGEVRVHPTGKVTVFTGSHSHGQGHETTFAQVVADRLGIPLEDVDIQHGDTGKILFGMGTYGSRSLAVGGTAIIKAVDKVIAKGRKIAAHLLEAGEADIEFRNGEYRVAGTDRAVPFAQVSLTAYVPHNYPLDKLEPGLNENAFYDPSNFTYPAGSYVCEVEVDPATGQTRVDRFSAVDDFGNIVNPMIVEGQVHGGLAQGIGQALLEHGVYDADSGQLLSGSYMDYALPRADDLPSFNVQTAPGTPCTHNPLGVKGCGEAGAIGSPAAVINAICDAIGVKDIAMPATPCTVWTALQAKH
ncbi:xanthine dehydrogenase family protein molybdopterin-binding subunit [Roseateles saccharophilus]|uniref:Xanthine dehydrogenase molybdenum binding subunit apoprotein n=1 Tax=Roseateles saccharophilus TaxID=304 RepID=A0A4R3VKA1_ROSSA|nr:xanthine dehydrogenase family protein molybdopterin-binding subunit [Roseateles saccharophilus]MDG0831144.1 xanthine dehydrogenase family protein molybdopterin-binding subunit [Roseateles saccharophilus]TCV04264.1 xanthine dehydrogenase molybdenum binding subunit apoprotein [Roseateles saccharophilus]